MDARGQRHGQQPVSGTADPGVVKQDKSSRGSVDTTKTRSDPQRVRMCKGGRPIGAAKGKQTNTMALCHPPPPPPHFWNHGIWRFHFLVVLEDQVSVIWCRRWYFGDADDCPATPLA